MGEKMNTQKLIKPPVEVRYAEELKALQALDSGKRPVNWRMSPEAVRTFILGSREPLEYNGKTYVIEKKYFGNDACGYCRSEGWQGIMDRVCFILASILICQMIRYIYGKMGTVSANHSAHGYKSCGKEFLCWK